MQVAVTGAFGYSGRYIAQRLLASGHSVVTLTNSVHRHNPFGAKVRALRPCRPWILDAYMKSVTSATYNEGRDAIFSRDRERFARALMARGTALEVEIKAGRTKRALIDLGFSTGGVSEGIRYLQSVIDDRWRKPGAADKIFARAVEMLEAGKDAAESVH